jgi:hypothetical protein
MENENYGWRKEYDEWRNSHDFKQYKFKEQIDNAIVEKLESMLNNQEDSIVENTQELARIIDMNSKIEKEYDNICSMFKKMKNALLEIKKIPFVKYITGPLGLRDYKNKIIDDVLNETRTDNVHINN